MGRARLDLYGKLRSQIVSGSLPRGAALTSSRGLAAELGVARSTVVAVLEQLAAEGYIETRPGARARVVMGVMPLGGSRSTRAVRGHPASAKRAVASAGLAAYGRRVRDMDLPVPPSPKGALSRIDFLDGALSPQDFPTLLWRRAYARALVQRQARHDYAPPEGDATLRHELQADLHRARGLVCEAGQVLVVQGSQQAIDLCARLLLDPGEVVGDQGLLRCLPSEW